MAELVDALDSKSSSARSAGSIPARGTTTFAAAKWASARQGRLARAKVGSRAWLFVTAGVPTAHKVAGLAHFPSRRSCALTHMHRRRSERGSGNKCTGTVISDAVSLPAKISKTTPCKVTGGRWHGCFTRENILTRRANHRHHSIITQFVKLPSGSRRDYRPNSARLERVRFSSSPRMFLKQSASNSKSLRFSSIVSGYNSSLYLELPSGRSSGLASFGFQIIAPSHTALTAMSARLFMAISFTGFTACLPPSTGYYGTLNAISVHT